MAQGRSLGIDEVLVARADLEDWRDRVYMLTAALEDVEQDLGEAPSLKEYTEAFQHLHQAAMRLRGYHVEPRAVGGD